MSLRRFNPYYRWIFPWLLDRASAFVDEERKALLQQAQGRVLEIGSGTGSGFSCYGGRIDSLIALEPELPVMKRAQEQLEQETEWLRQRTQLLLADAHHIPLPDYSVDTAVCFLVLCTVENPRKVLEELKRVLKPEGQLLFFEHVLSDTASIQRWQHRLNPFWCRCAGGCQLTRETAKSIKQAGFRLEEYQRYQHRRFPGIVNQLITGVAVPAGDASGSR